jgi:hypothetical protein
MDDGRQPSSAQLVTHDSVGAGKPGIGTCLTRSDESAEAKARPGNHQAKEYVRYEGGVCISTNTTEGYFSILKRGIKGVYHQVGKRQLRRYLAEFDFRYNTRKEKDGTRAWIKLKGSVRCCGTQKE